MGKRASLGHFQYIDEDIWKVTFSYGIGKNMLHFWNVILKYVLKSLKYEWSLIYYFYLSISMYPKGVIGNMWKDLFIIFAALFIIGEI